MPAEQHMSGVNTCRESLIIVPVQYDRALTVLHRTRPVDRSERLVTACQFACRCCDTAAVQLLGEKLLFLWLSCDKR